MLCPLADADRSRKRRTADPLLPESQTRLISDTSLLFQGDGPTHGHAPYAPPAPQNTTASRHLALPTAGLVPTRIPEARPVTLVAVPLAVTTKTHSYARTVAANAVAENFEDVMNGYWGHNRLCHRPRGRDNPPQPLSRFPCPPIRPGSTLRGPARVGRASFPSPAVLPIAPHGSAGDCETVAAATAENSTISPSSIT